MAVILIGSQQGQIDQLLLDCAVREVHHTELEVTDSHVEQGVDVSDHARKKPDTLKMEGTVSNTPLPKPGDPSSPLVVNGQTYSVRSSYQPGRAENAYRYLLEMADRPRIITITTSIRVYTSMVMTSLDMPRDAKIGDSVQFTAEFKEIRVVQSQSVQPPRYESKTKTKAALGSKTGAQTDSTTQKKSLLKTAQDGATSDWAKDPKLKTQSVLSNMDDQIAAADALGT